MGYAMLVGWLKWAKLKPADVFVVEPNEALRARAAALGCAVAADAGDIPSLPPPPLLSLP